MGGRQFRLGGRLALLCLKGRCRYGTRGINFALLSAMANTAFAMWYDVVLLCVNGDVAVLRGKVAIRGTVAALRGIIDIALRSGQFS